MKVFIAGATGALGRRVVPALLDGGHSVTAVARSIEKSAALRQLGATPREVDLFDATAAREAVRGHDTVINLTARIPPSSRAFLPGAWRVNARIRYTPDTIRFLQKGQAPAVGDPAGYVSSVSHDDAAAAVIAAPSSGRTYNVVDDEPVTRREYYDSLAAAFGLPAPKFPPRWLGKLAGSVGETLARSQRISNRALRSSGWTPRFPRVREGWAAISANLDPAQSSRSRRPPP